VTQEFKDHQRSSFDGLLNTDLLIEYEMIGSIHNTYFFFLLIENFVYIFIKSCCYSIMKSYNSNKNLLCNQICCAANSNYERVSFIIYNFLVKTN
jgi:hypothetical protein